MSRIWSCKGVLDWFVEGDRKYGLEVSTVGFCEAHGEMLVGGGDGSGSVVEVVEMY
jgi:hypothetical protein